MRTSRLFGDLLDGALQLAKELNQEADMIFRVVVKYIKSVMGSAQDAYELPVLYSLLFQ